MSLYQAQYGPVWKLEAEIAGSLGLKRSGHLCENGKRHLADLQAILYQRTGKAA